MKHYIRCRGHVDPSLLTEVRRMARLFGHISKLRHRIEVTLYPESAFEGERPAVGLFFGAEDETPCRIWIATGEQEMSEITDTLLHELAHYEQWRDRRTLDERGVASRAKALNRLMGGVR